jgi:hypothetical protein
MAREPSPGLDLRQIRSGRPSFEERPRRLRLDLEVGRRSRVRTRRRPRRRRADNPIGQVFRVLGIAILRMR